MKKLDPHVHILHGFPRQETRQEKQKTLHAVSSWGGRWTLNYPDPKIQNFKGISWVISQIIELALERHWKSLQVTKHRHHNGHVIGQQPHRHILGGYALSKWNEADMNLFLLWHISVFIVIVVWRTDKISGLFLKSLNYDKIICLLGIGHMSKDICICHMW